MLDETIESTRTLRLEIDKGARSVRVDGDDKPLTGYQFTLLLTLAERAGRVLTRDALMDLMKGEKLDGAAYAQQALVKGACAVVAANMAIRAVSRAVERNFGIT